MPSPPCLAGGSVRSPEGGNNSYYIHGTDAYLFSIDHSRYYPLALSQLAVYPRASHGPNFGGGHDLVVPHSPNQATDPMTTLRCNGPHSYAYEGEAVQIGVYPFCEELTGYGNQALVTLLEVEAFDLAP